MRVNKSCIIVELTSQDITRAFKFADARLFGSESLYAGRGGGTSSKLKIDIAYGLLGEIAVSRFLNGIGISTSKPDVSIYSNSSKTYDADLYCGDLRLHCKTQSVESKSKYGISYLFQKNDPLVHSPTSKDFIAMSVVDVRAGLAFIYSFYPARKIKEIGMFEEPRVPMLRRTKKAIYFDNLLFNSKKDYCWQLFRKRFSSCPKFKPRAVNDYRYLRDVCQVDISEIKFKVPSETVKSVILAGPWYLKGRNGKPEYAVLKGKSNLYLHHLIYGPIREGNVIDHKDRDPTNNCYYNLREVTRLENSMNRYIPIRLHDGEYSSKYKGVSKRRDGSSKWTAYITIAGVNTYLGDFSSEKKAALAYDQKARELYGDKCFLNFSRS